MADSRLTVRFEGVSGVSGAASTTRDGGAESVLPAGVLSAAGIEVVGAAEMFELDPPTAARGGDWAGRAGVVEIAGPVERDAAELLLVRCGPTGYRIVMPEAGSDRLVYRIPVTPGPGTDRGALAGAMRWVVQKVVVPLAGDIVGAAGEHVVARWERARRPPAMRFYTPRLYQTPKSEPVDPGDLDGRRVLVLLHGLNAQSHDRNGLGAMPLELVEELNRCYDHVLAFDHPTLATSPADNAAALRTWLAASRIGEVDFLCHSRGGLVARSLLEREGADLGVTVGSVVFVGTPHRGTPLASAEHLGGLVDRLLTLAMVVPDNPVTVAVEGVLTVAKEMAVQVYDRLDGVRAMRPVGEGGEGADAFLAELSGEASGGCAVPDRGLGLRDDPGLRVVARVARPGCRPRVRRPAERRHRSDAQRAADRRRAGLRVHRDGRVRRPRLDRAQPVLRGPLRPCVAAVVAVALGVAVARPAAGPGAHDRERAGARGARPGLEPGPEVRRPDVPRAAGQPPGAPAAGRGPRGEAVGGGGPGRRASPTDRRPAAGDHGQRAAGRRPAGLAESVADRPGRVRAPRARRPAPGGGDGDAVLRLPAAARAHDAHLRRRRVRVRLASVGRRRRRRSAHRVARARRCPGAGRRPDPRRRPLDGRAGRPPGQAAGVRDR